MSESTQSSDPFPVRLRAAREKRGLSQGKLAERAKLQASAVSHFETGARKPSFDNLRRLADALRITTDFLLGRTDDMEGSGDSANILNRHYAGLSSEYQEMVDDFMELLTKKSEMKKKIEDDR